MEIKINICGMKRLLWTVLLLLPVANTAASPLAPLVEVQCILVEKAQIAQKPLAKEGEFGRANYGHQIVAGIRSVLAIRIYEDPDRGPDSQTFKKATLEFKLPPGIVEGTEVAVDVLRCYYAEGASGWVSDGGYGWAKDPFPRIHFRRDGTGLYATLKQNVRVIEAEKRPGRPNPLITLNVTCPIRKQALLKLTPWTGREGTEWPSFLSQGVSE